MGTLLPSIVLLWHCMVTVIAKKSNNTTWPDGHFGECEVEGGCKHGGTCVFNVCLCTDGYQGFQCEYDSANHGDCSSAYDCNYNGICVSGVCSCLHGYHGAFCESQDYQEPTDWSNGDDYYVDENYTSRVIIVAVVVSLLSIFGLCLCCICIALRNPQHQPGSREQAPPTGRRPNNERRYSYVPAWYRPFETRRLSSLSANTLQLPDGRRVHIPSYPDGNSYDGDPNSPSPYLPAPDQPPEYNRVTERQGSVPETPPPTYEAAVRFKFRDTSQTQLAIEEVPENDEVFYPSEDENEPDRTRIETDV